MIPVTITLPTPQPQIASEAQIAPVAIEIPEYRYGELIPEIVIDELISRHATGYKAYGMKRTLWCESGFWNIQSRVVKNGVRESSWGISQIHEPSHPHITREQALDPEFSIKFMSDNWGKVKWYGWDSVNDKCN